MNYLKKLAGQSLIYGLGTIVPRLLNFAILTPFYTRVFEPKDYGVITELFAYVVVLMVVLTYGLETGFFRFANKQKNKYLVVYNTLSLSLLITSLLFISVIYFNLNLIARFIGYANRNEFILYLALIVSLDAFTSLPFARLRLEGKVRKFAIIKLCNIIFTVIVSFIILKFGKNYKGDNLIFQKLYNEDIGVGYVFIINVLASLINFILLYKEIFTIRFKIDLKLYKQVLIYSFPLLISGLAGSLNEAIDRIILKHFGDNSTQALETLGIYGANYKLAVFMTLFIQMFKYAVEPFFFEHAKSKDAKVMYSTIMNYFFILGLFIFLGITLYLDIFKYFIDPKFHEGLKIVPIVLIANLLLGVFYNLSVWYKINDLTKIGAIIAFSGTVVTVTFNFLLIPKLGYLGSAITHLVCYSFMVILSYLLSIKYYFIKYPVFKLLAYLLLALVIFYIDKHVFSEFSIVLSYILKTTLFALFIIFINYKEKLLRTFILKS